MHSPVSGHARRARYAVIGAGLLLHALAAEGAIRVLPLALDGALRQPATGPEASRLELALCSGEYEPALFAVQAGAAAVPDLSVLATELQGPGERIPASRVNVRFLVEWYQSASAWRSHRQWKRRTPTLVPELLLKDPATIRVDRLARTNLLRVQGPDGPRYVPTHRWAAERGFVTPTKQQLPFADAETLQPLDLEPGAQQKFVATVHAPADAPPGTYRGSLRILSGDLLLRALPLVVEVLPFQLEPPSLSYGLYYRGRLDEGNPTISSEQKDEAQLRAELRNLVAHGFRDATVYQPWPRPDQDPAERRRALELVRRHLAIRDELGLSDRPLYYLGRMTRPWTDDPIAQLEKDTRAILAEAGRFGIPAVYLYGIDEAKGKELAGQRDLWRAVHRAGGRVFAAGSRGHTSIMGGLTDLLVFKGDPSPVAAAEQHQFGNRIFSYANPQTGPEDPDLFRARYGVELWRSGFDGAMLYAYQHSMGFIYDDADHFKYRDHVLAYPTSRDPIDTIAWEALREAVDDVRYIATLEARMADASGPPRRRAVQLLAEIRGGGYPEPARLRELVISRLRDLVPGEPTEAP